MTTQGQFMSRDEYRRQKTLDEARRQGKIPAAVDEEGREINPHMPQYIIHAPWYLNYNGPSLKHQRIRAEPEKTKLETWYPRGLKGEKQIKFQRGACSNCGATTHTLKECCERPRQVGAQFSGSDLKADDVLVSFDKLGYDEKRDRWNGFDPDSYKDVILEHQLYEQKRRELREKEFGEKNVDDEFRTTEQGENQTQITSRDPRTKTMTRNLRIREDQANYLLNLDTNSAYFDPKSRSLRDNPNPHLPDEKQTFKGLNAIKNSGDTLKLFQQEMFAWHHSEKNNLELNSVALPTLTEKTFKQIKQRKEQQKIGRTGGLLDKYGGEEHLDAEMDLIFGQTDRYVEYNELGQPVNTRKKDPTKSKYPEDVYYGDHTSVWGSWWNETLNWGYDCCHSNEKHSACLGEKGKRLALTKEYDIRRQLLEEANKKEKTLEQQQEIQEPTE